MVKRDRKDPKDWKAKYRGLKNRIESERSPGDFTIMSHEYETVPVIKSLIRREGIELIVELGTGPAGFTMVLHDANPNILIYSFDKYGPDRLSKTRWKGMLEYMDKFPQIFNENVTLIVEDVDSFVNPKVVELLRLPGKKLLYCDGGDKRREIVQYAPYLKTGDFLGVHDWGWQDIHYGLPGVEEALQFFAEHPTNDFFIAQGLKTRLFVREED